MQENFDNNKILENYNDSQELEFKYNFVTTPWDDRSNRSKIGIIALLIAIFFATMACVVNNFVMHFRGFNAMKNANNSELYCFRVKIEDYLFVARIYSTTTKELLCVGAVISATSILANGICIKSGPIRVHIGTPTHPKCKKGFSVNVIETLYHDGVVSKKLALLSSYDIISKCSHPIGIGNVLDFTSNAQILGRPTAIGGRSLTRQYATLVKKHINPLSNKLKRLNIENMICVKDLARCPVRAGDLLVQNGKLIGLASTSVHRTDKNNEACFADLQFVLKELKELDTDIKLL